MHRGIASTAPDVGTEPCSVLHQWDATSPQVHFPRCGRVKLVLNYDLLTLSGHEESLGTKWSTNPFEGPTARMVDIPSVTAPVHLMSASPLALQDASVRAGIPGAGRRRTFPPHTPPGINSAHYRETRNRSSLPRTSAPWCREMLPMPFTRSCRPRRGWRPSWTPLVSLAFFAHATTRLCKLVFNSLLMRRTTLRPFMPVMPLLPLPPRALLPLLA